MTRTLLILLILGSSFAAAQQASFRVKVPDSKGKQTKGVLTFNDQEKTLEVRPAKRDPVRIPYAQIEKCSYEYSSERKMTMMESKAHWLEIEYRDQDAPRTLLVRMDGHDSPRILEALKAQTGIDAEILGNADKRRGSIWHRH